MHACKLFGERINLQDELLQGGEYFPVWQLQLASLCGMENGDRWLVFFRRGSGTYPPKPKGMSPESEQRLKAKRPSNYGKVPLFALKLEQF